jgi:hypothetical protein
VGHPKLFFLSLIFFSRFLVFKIGTFQFIGLGPNVRQKVSEFNTVNDFTSVIRGVAYEGGFCCCNSRAMHSTMLAYFLIYQMKQFFLHSCV